MTIESNRNLGAIAAILTLIGIISQIASLFQHTLPTSTGITIFSGIGSVFSVLSLIGFLLFLIAMYGFSKDYQDSRIFNYLIYGIIITIVAVVILFAIILVAILSNFATLFPANASSAAQSTQISKTLSLIIPLFSLVGVIWIIYNVKAFNLLSDKSKVPLFRTGAKVLIAGALVNIVLAIIFVTINLYLSISLNTLIAILTTGNLIQDVAWLLLAMAFFRIQSTAVPVSGIMSNALPASAQAKYCPNCGAANQLDAAYCTRC